MTTWVMIAPNIYEYARKDGTSRYQFRHYNRNTRKQESITTEPPEGINERQLKIWLDKTYADFADSIEHNRFSVDSRMTMDSYYFGVYLNKPLSAREKTIDDYTKLYKNHIGPYIGPMKLEDISRLVLQSMQKKLTDKGVGASTRRKANTIVSIVLNEAVADDIIMKNPAQGRNIAPMVHSKETQALTEKELVEFLALVDREDTLEWQTLIYIMAYTGMRRGEIAALEWRHIDLESNIIRVEQSVSKRTGCKQKYDLPKTPSSIRDIPLLAPAREKILAFMKITSTEGFVFKGRTDPTVSITKDAITRHFDRLTANREGIKRVTPQMLRTTLPSILTRNKEDIMVAQRILGHSSIATTDKYYLRCNIGDKRDVMGTFTDAVDGVRNRKQDDPSGS